MTHLSDNHSPGDVFRIVKREVNLATESFVHSAEEMRIGKLIPVCNGLEKKAALVHVSTSKGGLKDKLSDASCGAL